MFGLVATLVGVSAPRTSSNALASIAPESVDGSAESSDVPAGDPDPDEIAPTGQLERAMDVFRRGSENYGLGRYEQALADFQEATTLHASPDFQFNIGLCYEKLNQRTEAIRAFETYVRAKPEASDRAEVEARIVRLRDELRLGNEADEAAPTIPPDATRRSPETTFVISGSVLLGVGVALSVGGGTAFGMLAAQRSDALDEVMTGGNPDDLTFDEATELADQGQSFEAGQIATLVLGGAFAVGGATLLGIGLHRRAHHRKRIDPPSEVAARVEHLRIILDPGSRRVAVVGRF